MSIFPKSNHLPDWYIILQLMENKPTLSAFFKYCPLHILKSMQLVEYQKNAFIINKGQHIEHLFFILNGKVNIITSSVNQRDYSHAIYQSGDIIGELEAFDDAPCISSAVTLTQTLLIRLPRETFLEWLHKDAHFNQLFIEKSMQLFYAAALKSTEDLFYKLEDKLIEHLYFITHHREQRNSTTVEINKKQLAQTFSVTLRSINRTLKKLSEAQLIASTDGVIFTVNLIDLRERYKKIAD